LAGPTGALVGGIFLVWPEFLLSAFGDDFRQGAIVLRILAVGQIVNSLTGANGVALGMLGHHRVSAVSLVVVGILFLLITPVATAYYGIAGAASAAAAALVSWNIFACYVIYRRNGLQTWVSARALYAARDWLAEILQRGRISKS
jgi:O-antigen/teichoic acid export membrane protein